MPKFTKRPREYEARSLSADNLYIIQQWIQSKGGRAIIQHNPKGNTNALDVMCGLSGFVAVPGTMILYDEKAKEFRCYGYDEFFELYQLVH